MNMNISRIKDLYEAKFNNFFNFLLVDDDHTEDEEIAVSVYGEWVEHSNGEETVEEYAVKCIDRQEELIAFHRERVRDYTVFGDTDLADSHKNAIHDIEMKINVVKKCFGI